MFPVTLRGKQVPMGSGMFVVELINANKGIRAECTHMDLFNNLQVVLMNDVIHTSSTGVLNVNHCDSDRLTKSR